LRLLALLGPQHIKMPWLLRSRPAAAVPALLLLLLFPLLALASAPPPYAFAPFRVASSFSESGVLQRAPASAAVWGWATPGSTVATMVNGTFTGAPPTVFVNATARAGDGLWVARLPPLPAGAPYVVSITDEASGAAVWYLDIAVGIVLVCGGQSNQDLSVSYIFNATAEAATANAFNDAVRLLRVPLQAYSARAGGAPLADFLALVPWVRASNTSVWSFSAECWLTARDLAQGTGVRVGAIQSDWPGDSIAMLSSPAAMAACNSTPPTPPMPPSGVGERWGAGVGVGGGAGAGAASSTAAVAPRSGLAFPGPIPGPHAPSSQWTTMIAPFLVGPLAVEAFIYHQGEADALNGYAYYACHLAALINDWRATFASGTGPGVLPWFGVVQLAPWGGENVTGYSLGVAEVRQAQFDVARALQNVTVAVIDDDGDPLAPAGSVHSRRKQLVAARLAAGAMAVQYGHTGTPIIGPVYASAADVSGGGTLAADVVFEGSSVAGGLTLQLGLNNTSFCPVDAGIPLSSCAWFALRGAQSGAWVNATGVEIVNGTAVRLSAAAGGDAAVSATAFGWGAYPVVTLFNGAGLPVTPWNRTL
jgi:sialate O-acetylesterase